MEYRKLAKLSVNLLLVTYIRSFLVVALAEERFLRDGAGKTASYYILVIFLSYLFCLCASEGMSASVLSRCALTCVLFLLCCVLFVVC